MGFSPKNLINIGLVKSNPTLLVLTQTKWSCTYQAYNFPRPRGQHRYIYSPCTYCVYNSPPPRGQQRYIYSLCTYQAYNSPRPRGQHRCMYSLCFLSSCLHIYLHSCRDYHHNLFFSHLQDKIRPHKIDSLLQAF